MVLNMGPRDWESSNLTTRPSLHNCYNPFRKGICLFYINIFLRKILNSFFISAELFGFISRGILSISLFVSFLIVQTKSTEV